MSHLKESRCVKVLTRDVNVTNMTAYIHLSFPINEDATCRYTQLNTSSPATSIYAEWQYSNLSGFCQMVPCCSPSATPVLQWNYFNCGRKNPNTGYNPIDLASSLKHYNRLTGTTAPKINIIGFKSFALAKNVSYMMYDTNATTALTNDRMLTTGALIILPIGDNR